MIAEEDSAAVKEVNTGHEKQMADVVLVKMFVQNEFRLLHPDSGDNDQAADQDPLTRLRSTCIDLSKIEQQKGYENGQDSCR